MLHAAQTYPIHDALATWGAFQQGDALSDYTPIEKDLTTYFVRVRTLSHHTRGGKMAMT